MGRVTGLCWFPPLMVTLLPATPCTQPSWSLGLCWFPALSSLRLGSGSGWKPSNNPKHCSIPPGFPAPAYALVNGLFIKPPGKIQCE